MGNAAGGGRGKAARVNQQQQGKSAPPRAPPSETDTDSCSGDDRGDEGDDLDDDESPAVARVQGQRRSAPVPHERMQAQTWYQKARGAYDSLVLAIIRPPRSAYELADLGPSKFAFCGKFFKRTDFAIKNAKGQKLCCSMWEPFEIDKKGDGVKSSSALSPCVIYMHGNSSNRREAISQLSLVLSLGAKLVTLDFSGSGKSDGEYVSLGVHEKDDLQCLIKHLRDSGTVGKIGLWGRSMGAATCLLHGRRDSELACMVCDSPFSSLVALAEGMVETGRKHGIYAPGFLISLAIRFIRSSVQDKAGFDVYDLNPAEEAEHSIVPLLLIAAEGDAFIPPSHAQLIYHNYGGPKHAIIVQGDHNSIRPKKVLDSVAIFLANALQIPDEGIIPDGLHFVGQPPWLQQQQLEEERAQGGFSPATVKQLAPNGDIGVGMDRKAQDQTKDKLFNLIGGGSR